MSDSPIPKDSSSFGGDSSSKRVFTRGQQCSKHSKKECGKVWTFGKTHFLLIKTIYTDQVWTRFMGTNENEPVGLPGQKTVVDEPQLQSNPTKGLSVESVEHPDENTFSFSDTHLSGKLESKSVMHAGDMPTTLGRFKINGVLGTGGFGKVYLGYDDRLKRKVAIKVPTQVLSGIELDKFLEEAQRLAQLRHPGIVTVFDIGP